jgi:hypothetical protein
MKRVFLIQFILQVTLSCPCVAQQQQIDSLQKILPSLEDTARIDCLINIGIQYIFLELDKRRLYQPYRDSVLYYTNTAFDEAKKINYIHGIAESFVPKAALKNHFLSNFKEMEKLARESLKWFALTGNKRQIETPYWQVAAALFFQYRNEEAEAYLEQSFYWAEKNDNSEWMLFVLGFQYETYRDIGEYEKAYEAFRKTQQLNLSFKGQKDLFYESYVLAELQRRLGNYSTALNHYKELVAMMNLPHENIWFRVCYPELFALNGQFDSAQYYYDRIDSSKCNPDEMRFYLVSLGEFYLLKNKYAEAIGLLTRGLFYHREAKDKTQVNRTILDIANTYTALKNDNEALVYAREALDLSKRTHSKQYTRDACRILYEIFQRKENTDSAFTYFRQYISQKEIVADDVMKGKFAAYDYEQQIELLNSEKQLQHQQLNQSSQQKSFLIIGITGLLLLSIFIIRSILLKRKNEANRRAIAEKELLLQKTENEKTKAELQQQATDLEMQALRAQMNPHFIFNSLNSINRFILQNNKSQASEYLTKFSKLVRLILQNSQAALITLESEMEALEIYLELEALRFEYHFTYQISIPKDMDIEILKVPPLIIQPYAENAIWHGLMHKEQKGKLTIEVLQEDQCILFKITDDGIGRKQAKKLSSKSATTHKSLGLKITAARIAMMQTDNGSESSVTINDLSQPDGSAAGTEVVITLPVLYQ